MYNKAFMRQLHIKTLASDSIQRPCLLTGTIKSGENICTHLALYFYFRSLNSPRLAHVLLLMFAVVLWLLEGGLFSFLCACDSSKLLSFPLWLHGAWWRLWRFLSFALPFTSSLSVDKAPPSLESFLVFCTDLSIPRGTNKGEEGHDSITPAHKAWLPWGIQEIMCPCRSLIWRMPVGKSNSCRINTNLH